MGLYIPQSFDVQGMKMPGALLRLPTGAIYDALKRVKCGYIVWDPEVATLDTNVRSLTSYFTQFPITYDASVSVVSDPNWGNHKVFDFTSGAQHYMHVNDKPPPRARAASGLPAFDLLLTGSVSQATLDLVSAMSLTAAYATAKYDTPHNTFISGLNLFGSGGNKGWSWSPKSASGNGFNVLWNGSVSGGPKFDQTKPTAALPFVLRIKFETPAVNPALPAPRTDFYWYDLGTILTSRGDHTAYDDGSGGIGGVNSRYQIGSFAPVGGNTASWRDKIGIGGIFDRSNPATAINDNDWSAIGTAVHALYDIAA